MLKKSAKINKLADFCDLQIDKYAYFLHIKVNLYSDNIIRKKVLNGQEKCEFIAVFFTERDLTSLKSNTERKREGVKKD